MTQGLEALNETVGIMVSATPGVLASDSLAWTGETL